MQLDLREALKDSQGLSVRPFGEISPRRCTAFPAIFNISKPTQVARIRAARKKAEGKSRENWRGCAAYQKLKFHSAKLSGRYRDPLRECDGLPERERYRKRDTGTACPV